MNNVVKEVKVEDGALRVETTYGFFRRLFVLLKNPFTYVFCGKWEV